MSAPEASLDRRRTGWGLAALGMLLVSTDSFFVRLSELDGWDVTFLVAALSLPLQLTLQQVFDGGRPLEKFLRFPRGLLAVGALSAGSQTTFVLAVTKTDVANVVVIVAASPIIAAAVGRLVFGERTSGRVWAGIAVTVVGVLIVVSGSLGEPSLQGDLLAVAAIVCFAVSINIWRRYREASRFVGLALSAAGALVVSAFFAENPLGHDARAYFSVACMGLAFNPLGRLCHTSAPRFAPSSEVALFTPVETLAATTWAWVAFGESPEAATFAGGAVVIAGMLYGTVAHRPR